MEQILIEGELVNLGAKTVCQIPWGTAGREDNCGA